MHHPLYYTWKPNVAGLIEETEEAELKGLVESRVKRLHFRPPRVHAAEPWQLMRQHPLFSMLSRDSLLEVEKVNASQASVVEPEAISISWHAWRYKNH